MKRKRRMIALTRPVSPSIVRCELTHLARESIDFGLAVGQHGEYESVLADLGCDVRRLPAEPDLPDSVFVEDAAIVLDECAIITRPGAQSRRPETPSVAAALEAYRSLLHRIEEPGTLDGGDLLTVGRTIYAGLSSRSDAGVIEQLRFAAGRYGYRVKPVAVSRCLHLKSAATRVGPGTLLVNRRWVDASLFGEMELIDVDPAEPMAANALLVGGSVVYPAAFPLTRERLEKRGILVRTVDLTELAKAEGAATCCSLIFRELSGG
ncbi:MAG: dimethylargininase [Candidatus Krumholzibacteria bacterium]|nr:dimethylargininase [Candidatus Krumholzibacteria bacterium]